MRTEEAPQTSILPRPFQWDDLEEFTGLVNAIRGLAGGPRAFSTTSLGEWLGQPGCNPEENCFVEERRGALVGYALVVPELAIGRVVVEGGVLPDCRRQGIGGRLLEAALQRALALGAGVVHIAAPGDNAESRRFLERRGFALVRRHWEMRWQGKRVAQPSIPPGFSLRSFASGDEGLLTRVQNDAFGGSWGFCPNTVEEISHRAKLSCFSPEGIPFLLKGDDAVAYCWTRLDEDESQRVGTICMTGTVPAYRGLGLGRAILLAGMGYLQSQGAEAIDLTVDEDNVHARDIYLSVGFRKVAESLWYERKLGP